MLTVKRISGADDLALLVRQINDAEWDDANEMAAYGVAALAAYLQREDTVFVACYGVENGVDTPVIGLLPLGVDPRQAARDLAPK